VHALARFFESNDPPGIGILDSSLNRRGGFGVDFNFVFGRDKRVNAFRVCHAFNVAYRGAIATEKPFLQRLNSAAVEEGVLLVNERRRIGEDDGDSIETDLAPGDAGAGRITARGPNDVLLLIGSNGAVRRTEIRRSAGFHFDEDHGVAIAGDDIDLRFAFVRAIVAGHHPEAGVSQIAVGEIFAAAPQSGIGRERAAFAKLPRGIAYFPEQLPGLDVSERFLSTSRCHSMTLPRTR